VSFALAGLFAFVQLANACAPPGDELADASTPLAEDAGVLSLTDSESPEEPPMFKMKKLRNTIAVLGVVTAGIIATQQAVPNAAPVMGALSPVSGSAGVAIAITGSCTDDGKPTPPEITYQWAKTAGPGSCTFGSATTASTTATCTTAGSITLSLTCCDQGAAAACTGLTDGDTLTATVTGTPLPIDSIVAAGGSLPNFCGSTSHRLTNTYSGNLLTVWRVSDDATQAIGYGGDDKLAEASITSFCGASDCLVSTLEDQCGSNRDLTQTTESAMPKIYDGATTRILKNGLLPVAYFDGGDRLGRTDSVGITGASAVTLAHFTASDTSQTFFRHVLGVGANTAGQGFESMFSRSGQNYFGVINYYEHRPYNWISGAAYRGFDLNRDTQAYRLEHGVVALLDAGQQIGSSTHSYDGVTSLAQIDVNGATNTLAAGTTRTVVGQSMAHANGFVGDGNFFLISGQHYTGAVKAALDAWLAYLDLQARLGAPTLIATGQSNVEMLTTNAWLFANRFNQSRVARGGAPISEWDTGQIKFTLLCQEVMRADLAFPIVIAMGQGEADAANPGWAAAYLTALRSLVARVDAATGRSPRWLFTKLHTQGTYATAPNIALVNTAFDTVAAERPGNAAVIEIEPLGNLIVGETPSRAHWDPALQTAWMGHVAGLVNALPRRPTQPKRDRTRAPGNVVSLASRRRQREERELVRRAA
jgi:hypothetical protein